MKARGDNGCITVSETEQASSGSVVLKLSVLCSYESILAVVFVVAVVVF